MKIALIRLLVIGLWYTGAAAQQTLDLFEGDICKQENGVLWTCKFQNQCPKAQSDFKRGKRPLICSFAGQHPVVCCEPTTKPPPRKSNKSQAMCKKYAKFVYSEFPQAIGDGVELVDTCANVEPLIVGGVDAQSKEYPHMALIGYGANRNSINWLCGGTLISERFVLSAAHCTHTSTKGSARWVRLGEFNINSKVDEEMQLSNPVDIEIIERINHPLYNGNTSLYNDISLYRLKENVVFNEYIRPICLNTKHTFHKTYAIATGWGNTEFQGKRSDILQKVNVTITQRKTCSDAYKNASGGKLTQGIQDDSQMCAGDAGTIADTCQGDSGGPLQVRLADPYCMYSQIGITSFGDKCGTRRPGVYTRVSHYVPWIESIVWP